MHAETAQVSHLHDLEQAATGLALGVQQHKHPYRFASSPSASLITAGLPESSLANHSGVTLYSSNEMQQTKKPQRKVKLGLKSRNNAENQMVMNMVVAFL